MFKTLVVCGVSNVARSEVPSAVSRNTTSKFMATKVIKVLREEKDGSKDKIDLLYDDVTHEFILRFFQWGSLREAIVMQGTEFIAMLQAGVKHYKGMKEHIDQEPMTDTLQ